jgi:hypothetical protein
MAEGRPASHEIEVVRRLIEGVRGGQAQDPIVLAEAQERGFGALMSLEAQLQRAQRARRDSTAMPAGAAGDEEELTAAIRELSDALAELRDLTCPPGGPSRAGYGFVLPGPAVPRHGRHTQS